MTKPLLRNLRASIQREAGQVDRKPYSHNIITLDLRLINHFYGKYQANKAIVDFKLERKGWETA